MSNIIGKMRVCRSMSTTGMRLSYSQAMALLRPSKSSSVSKTSIPVCVKSERPLKQECVSRWLSVQSCARNHCNVRSNSMNSPPVRNFPRKRLSRCSSSRKRRQATSSSHATRRTAAPSAGSAAAACAPATSSPSGCGGSRRSGSPSGSPTSGSLSPGSSAAGTPKTAPPRCTTCSTPISSGSCGQRHSPAAVTSNRSISKRPVGKPRATSRVTVWLGQQSGGKRAKAV
mmetsp:Transcript_82202/g.228078  ORF Transcript_82202/g.228078 Transcript_82202/m.228078 type:complete len:229 (-) Transcript_82202:1006-1692(-)